MKPSGYQIFDPLLPEAEAQRIRAICEQFGRYGTYAAEALNDGIGEGLPQRFDSALNFIRTGGRFGRKEDPGSLASRTNYFRETYAYGNEVTAPGIEPFLHHEGFVEAARRIHDRPIIEPAIVFANLLVPGQELAIHTDVPEFRGANRKLHPQWLLVVMHHSGLFAEWRMPIATAVSWWQDAEGGAFAFYPDGADGKPVAHAVQHNTAVILDTDSVFHGVDRVGRGDAPIPRIDAGSQLDSRGDGRWQLRTQDSVQGEYAWEELRFSISWKAYCFRDEAERRAWSSHADDLAIEFILDRLEQDLRDRGRMAGARPEAKAFATLLVDEYIRFPHPESS